MNLTDMVSYINKLILTGMTLFSIHVHLMFRALHRPFAKPRPRDAADQSHRSMGHRVAERCSCGALTDGAAQTG